MLSSCLRDTVIKFSSADRLEGQGVGNECGLVEVGVRMQRNRGEGMNEWA